MTRTPFTLPASAFAAVVLCACGEPGVATPMPEPPAIDTSSFTGREVVATAAEDSAATSVTIATGPNATRPGAEVRLTNLDTTDPPSVEYARSDGGFSVGAAATSGDRLRLQAVVGDLRGPPSDVLYENGDFSPIVRLDCLAVSPPLSVTFGGAGSGARTEELTLENECPEAVSLENLRSRLALPDFAMELPEPATIAPGGDVALRVRFSPTGPGDREDVVTFDVVSADTTVTPYPVTVFGKSR